MLSFAHTLISLPLAVYFDSPLIIFAAAAVFLLFCDTRLHWNIYPDETSKFPTLAVATDVLGGLVAATALMGPAIVSVPVLAAIAGGNAPDILHTSWELLPRAWRRRAPRWLQRAFVLHDGLQEETHNVAAGLVWQVFFIAFAILLLVIPR